MNTALSLRMSRCWGQHEHSRPGLHRQQGLLVSALCQHSDVQPTWSRGWASEASQLLLSGQVPGWEITGHLHCAPWEAMRKPSPGLSAGEAGKERGAQPQSLGSLVDSCFPSTVSGPALGCRACGSGVRPGHRHALPPSSLWPFSALFLLPHNSEASEGLGGLQAMPCAQFGPSWSPPVPLVPDRNRTRESELGSLDKGP